MVLEQSKNDSSNEEAQEEEESINKDSDSVNDVIEIEIEEEQDQSFHNRVVQLEDKNVFEEESKEQVVGHKQKFFVGENIDCRDTVKKWLNAEIVAVRQDQQQIRVHFSGWSRQYDEWINIDSERILKQWRGQDGGNKDIQVNNRIDVFHQPSGQWFEALVLEVQEKVNLQSQMVRIHYVGYHSKYDEFVNVEDNKKVLPVGSLSSAYGGVKRVQLSRKVKELLIRREKEFVEELRANKGLAIRIMQGDGNCLFRAVSDQMYGTEQYHDTIRSSCMDYIQNEKGFFVNYITEDFEEYVTRKRQDGEWGDDIELEALSEIYNRPIEVFAYSSKPMRTFHETNFTNSEPIRLSYHGGCHYNSVKRVDAFQHGYIDQSLINKIETQALLNSKERRHAQNNDIVKQENNVKLEQEIPALSQESDRLSQSIHDSRKEFAQIGKRDMQRALEESLHSFNEREKDINEQQFVDEAIKTSIDEFMEAEEEKLILDQIKKETLFSRTEDEQKIIDDEEEDTFQSTQVKQIEELELQEAIKQSQANLLSQEADPLQNPTIATVVGMGLPLDLAIQAYTIIGDFPDMIINYIYENYY